MLPLAPTIFAEFKAVRTPGLFLYPVIAVAAGGAFEPDIFPH
jgi:hypothetical protein